MHVKEILSIMSKSLEILEEEELIFLLRNNKLKPNREKATLQN
jgi:hypothetical protein